MTTGLSVAIVGLNFGSYWIPSYLDHPDVDRIVLCDPDPGVLTSVGDQYGVSDRLDSLEAVLRDPDIDAVHLLTPLELHAAQSVAVLGSGRHCAVAVTAGLDVGQLAHVVRAEDASGKTYMMMETAAFTDPVVHLRDLVASGDFGEVSFARGEHHQDMSGWPGYWEGLPPMWYSTHALGPLLAVLDATPRSVRAHGSGRLPESLSARWGNPFPVEVALFELVGSSVVVEVTRSLFKTAHPQLESFSVYGSELGFDWGRVPTEDALQHAWGEPGLGGRGRTVVSSPFAPPDLSVRVPEPLRGHEPVLARPVHEFVRSIVESRRPLIDARTAAIWTAAGIAAHESAMSGGGAVEIPRFD
jgi:predicted dehydrogenase